MMSPYVCAIYKKWNLKLSNSVIEAYPLGFAERYVVYSNLGAWRESIPTVQEFINTLSEPA